MTHTLKEAPFANINAPCCRALRAAGPCQCGPEERVLRAYIDALPQLPPMTAEQREYCLSEIDSVEGCDRKDHENDNDADLSRAVLQAWMDYCRDKGLL